MEKSLTEALKDRQLDPLKSRLIAAQYAAAQKVLEEELARLLPDDASQRQVEHVVRAEFEKAVTEVFGVLRHGLGEIGLTATRD
jgi:hypothetical protein